MADSLLYQSVRFLAGRCDYAAKRDDQGYNQVDATFGHDLADRPEASWTPEEKHRAWAMLRKYRGQFASVGIDYDEIPEPDTAGLRMLAVIGGRLAFIFPYDAALVDRMRSLKAEGAAHFVNDALSGKKYWAVDKPAAALAWAEANGFAVTDEARALAEKSAVAPAGTAAQAAPVVPKPKRAGKVLDADDGGDLVFFFPYDIGLVERVKAAGMARWDKDARRGWIVYPRPDAVAKAVEFAGRNGFAVTEAAAMMAAGIVEAGQQAIEASRAKVSEFRVEGLGVEPFPFQRAGIEYLVAHPKSYLCDDMGLGKTGQSLAAVKIQGVFPCVIVCPASLKLVWQREIGKWLPGTLCYVVRNGGDHIPVGMDAYVVNYEMLRKRLADLQAAVPYKAVIFDEGHYMKSRTAQRSRAGLALAMRLGYDDVSEKGGMEVRPKDAAPVRYILTGTPVLSRPAELVHPLKILGMLGEFGGAMKFLDRYCDAGWNGWGMDYTGAKNLDELNEKLRRAGFLRRTKDEVLAELPAKRDPVVIPVEITNRSEYDEAERDLFGYIASKGGDVWAAERAEVLVRISTLRQLCGQGKIAAAAEWIGNVLDNNPGKLVVFAEHVAVQKAVQDAFSGCARVDAEDAVEVRQQNVDRFQNDPECRLIVCSLRAGGLGWTLTAAQDVAIIEQGWTPALTAQAVDRLHRIGQTGSVTPWIFQAVGTYDEELQALLDEKAAIVKATTDGGTVVDEGSIVKELLERMMTKAGIAAGDGAARTEKKTRRKTGKGKETK